MTKELSEDSKFQISIKTLIAIVVAVATVISAYFGLMATMIALLMIMVFMRYQIQLRVGVVQKQRALTLFLK